MFLEDTFPGKGVINVHPFGVDYCAWVAQSYLVKLCSGGLPHRC